MQNLPTELCRLIFNQLSIEDLDNLRLVAVRFNNIIDDTAKYWKLKYRGVTTFSINSIRIYDDNYFYHPYDLEFIIGCSRFTVKISNSYMGARGVEYGPYDIILNFKASISEAINDLNTKAIIRGDSNIDLIIQVDLSSIKIILQDTDSKIVSEYIIPKNQITMDTLIDFCEENH